MEANKFIILAIETAVEGGSLAIVEDGVEIDSWIGTKDVSKAEDVLEKISELLRENKIEKKNLSLIAVSNGPGSATGIKIGLAIAKGLGQALKIPIIEISALEALIGGETADDNKKIIAVLPIGRNLICWQLFTRIGRMGKPVISSAEEFCVELKNIEYSQIVLQKKAFDNCERVLKDNGIKDFRGMNSSNPAYLVAVKAKELFASDNVYTI